MSVTRSSAAERHPPRLIGRGRMRLAKGLARGPAWRVREGLGLAAAAPAVLAALALVFFAKRPVWAEFDARLARGELLNLSLHPSTTEIASALRTIGDPADRRFAAERITRALSGRAPARVGDLARIWVTEAEVRGARGLVSFPRRLAEARRLRAERELRASYWAKLWRWAGEASGLTGPTELRIPLFASGQFAEVKPGLVVRTPGELSRSLLLSAALLVAGFAAVHAVWSARGFRGDEALLPALLLLSGMSFVMMVSLRDPLRDTALFTEVGWGVLAGCGILLATSLIDFERRAARLVYVPLAASVLLSIALIAFGSGPTGSDAKVNLLGFQPVEVIKLLLVFFLAGFFARRWEVLRELRERRAGLGEIANRFAVPRLDHLLPVLACVGLALGFFLLQKDLGPALVMSCVFLALYGVARGRALLVAGGLGAIVLGFAAAYAVGYPGTVSSRIAMWLSPWDNTARGGDHLAHSLWALSSGGAFGTGLGLGRPAYVPAGHTDLILSCAGEELGFAGLVAIGLLFAVLVSRGLRIARSSSSDYGFFLALGVTALIAIQLLLISAGLLGLAPLTGVPTPVLSYGKSSLWATFGSFGMLAALSAKGDGRSAAARSSRRPVAAFAAVLLGLGTVALARAAYVQVARGDETAIAGTLTVQADLQRRFQYNPRLLEIARAIPRGTIFDRNGVPLATSDWDVLERHRTELDRLGVAIDRVCEREEGRHYPFGGPLFHVVGDLRSQVNWGASNTSFLERDAMMQLQGYDTHPRLVEVPDPATRGVTRTLAYDYRDLVPLLRHRSQPGHPAVRRITGRARDLRSTMDVRLQTRAAALLEKRLAEAGREKGAIVVLDAATGDLLASVSHPWPDLSSGGRARAPLGDSASGAEPEAAYLDRARYGLYPPGSTFKLVVAAAALANGRADATFTCARLPGRGVGARIPRWGTLRDDVLDKEPHGTIGLEQALTVSCNAYFGQLAVRTGAAALHETASAFGISVARPDTPEALARTLAPAGFGQGEVVASPLQLARVTAMAANEGAVPTVRWILEDGMGARNTADPAGNIGADEERTGADPAAEPASSKPWPPANTSISQGAAAGTKSADAEPWRGPRRSVLSAPAANRLARAMRSVVTSGTGRRLLEAPIPVAGKTGTAEVEGAPSHAWFAGYAPYGGGGRRIAFAVLVENGRYGGGIAAQIAADLVAEAHRLGLDRLDEDEPQGAR